MNEKSHEQKVIDAGKNVALLRQEFEATTHRSKEAIEKGNELVAAEKELNELIGQRGEGAHHLS